MQSLYMIVPVAMAFCAVAIAAWLWASRNGQYDDLDREARRILEDDDTHGQPVPGSQQQRHERNDEQ